MVCLLAFMPRPHSAGDEAITIDPTVTWGKWDGWGCSLCWWGKAFGDRDDLADAVFSTKTVRLLGQSLPGLGMNIARYNVGACSFNEVDGQSIVLSAKIPTTRRMEGFWLDGKSTDPNSASWNFTIDSEQRAMLQKARDRGADQFELFSNSPMWWMLQNRNPSGADDGSRDNLKPEEVGPFAIYLATVAKYASDHWNIHFTTVEPFNEPVSDWWRATNNQEGCHFSSGMQSDVIKALRTELDQRGLRDTLIAASDDNEYDQALRNWQQFDAATRQLVGQVNTHGYQKGGGRRDRLYAAVHADGKSIRNSEYGESNADGLEMARNIDLDFRYLHPNSWCYWLACDGSWGLIDGSQKDETIRAVPPKFFVLAHYSRHIRPGMIIVDSSNVNTVAAYDPTAHKLVLVTLNDGPARTLSYNLSTCPEAKGPITRWVTEPKSTTRYEFHANDTPLAAKSFQSSFPAESIQTFEIENVTVP